jgi:hypothetical protein
MASDKRRHGNPLEDADRGASPNRVERGDAPGNTGGLWSDLGDGTIGDTGKRLREMVDEEGLIRDEAGEPTTSEAPRDSQHANPPITAATNIDIAGETKHGQGPYVAGSLPNGGADDVGGMGTGTGRGRGSGVPGGVYGSGDSAGTGGMGGGFDSQVGTGGASGGLGNDIGGGLTGGTGGQGLPRRSDQGATGGGVAVSGGRGSDVGTVGGGMAPDLSSDTTGGMSGGTMGGSRESDVGGGLSGGMRSGMGDDASGGRGGASSRPRGTGRSKRDNNRKSD